MIQLANKEIKVNEVHKAIMDVAYSHMCNITNGLNTKLVMLADTEDDMRIEEGTEDDEGTYIVSIRFSDSFSGFLHNLIVALGFIAGGTPWMSAIKGKPTISDIWYDIFKELPDNIRGVF